jgi:outer membrane protein assembly factor BamA
MVAALLVACAALLCGADGRRAAHAGPPQDQPQSATPRVTEIRVHGNATMKDEDVIRLAGVAVGDPLPPDSVAAIDRRLRESGRFDEVQVRQRYRTLEMDDVALVLLVHEKPGVGADGSPPSTFHRLTSRLMFLPVLSYEDGYGWTYGGRTSVVDAFGGGERVSFPLTWGATRRAAIEAERTFTRGPLTLVRGSYGIAQRENPFYDVDDRRTELRGRVERRLFDVLVLGADAATTNITFAGAPDDFWTNGIDAAIDTRRDPAFPSDAVYVGVQRNWLRLSDRTVARYGIDGRGYKRLIGQAVLAVHAQYDAADASLPPYEQWLLGGALVRGIPAGSEVGDKRLIGSIELRVPFSSPLSAGRVGFTAFMDAGVDAAHSQALADAPARRGVGAGLFLVVPFVRLNLDVAHSLDGFGTRVHFGTGFTF